MTVFISGLQQAFQSGIYSPSIGFTMGFGNISKQLVALSGITMGSGELLGNLKCIHIFFKFKLYTMSTMST